MCDKSMWVTMDLLVGRDRKHTEQDLLDSVKEWVDQVLSSINQSNNRSHSPEANAVSDLVKTSLGTIGKLETKSQHLGSNFSRPRLRSKLERLMGSDVVLITDREYMQRLQEKIREDHEECVKKRIHEREDTMLRDCNLNTEDYKRILHSDCFVDKSLLINKFMTSETPVILVTAPRRFGKTINLNMLKTFLKIGEDETPDLTRDCSVLKKYNLNIYNYDNNSFFETHCGKYPIIHVTFKQLTGSNFKGILDGFKPILRGTFLEHDYLLKSSFLRGHEKDRIQLYTDKITYEKLTNRQILKGLKFLSHMLYLNFDKNVIVLIDDYDVLVKKLLEEKFPKNDIRKTVKFFTSFTSILLENNQFMDRALINSCLTLSTLLSANIQNIFHYPFLVQHDLVKYYGLTSKEVKQKLVQFNIIDKYHYLKEYYNGYKTDSGLNIYNTWSVLNYMQYEVLSNYWVNMTGLKEFFLKGIVRKWVTEVLNSGNVTIKTAKISFNDIFILKDIMLKRVALKRNEAVVFVEFLTDNGYFIQTIEDPKEVCLKIPNEEIRQHISKVINGEM